MHPLIQTDAASNCRLHSYVLKEFCSCIWLSYDRQNEVVANLHENPQATRYTQLLQTQTNRFWDSGSLERLD